MICNQTEIAVVGAGIVGLSNALAAAKAGCSVTVFDRSAQVQGASIRNFGMIWPIGLPEGPVHRAALLTREILLEIAETAGFWLNPCGSIHLAREEDEAAVLEEYVATDHARAAGCQIFTPDQVLRRSPAACESGLRCGLWSPVEMAVDSRELLRVLPAYLHDHYGVKFEFSTTVVSIDSPFLQTADGRRWEFDQALVCGGPDFETLFPDVFAGSGVRKCKLQMMRTFPQPGGWRMGPHIAGGASLRHYSSFANCPSVEKVRQRIAAQSPELDQYAIHVMAAQNGLGEVVIGDSHEYDQQITPFDKPEIDAVILQHLNKMVNLPDGRISQRWHGIYPRHRTLAQFTHSPQKNVGIVLNTNGLGMTLSLGLAELSRRDEQLFSRAEFPSPAESLFNAAVH